jgi:hypothetical protein
MWSNKAILNIHAKGEIKMAIKYNIIHLKQFYLATKNPVLLLHWCLTMTVQQCHGVILYFKPWFSLRPSPMHHGGCMPQRPHKHSASMSRAPVASQMYRAACRGVVGFVWHPRFSGERYTEKSGEKSWKRRACCRATFFSDGKFVILISHVSRWRAPFYAG